MGYELALVAIAGVWVTIGVVLSVVMRRRGYVGFSWFALGTVMGPMAVVFAFDALRHPVEQVDVVSSGVAGPGATDVLVGVDGSAESAAAVASAVRLFRPGLARLTLATVVADDAPNSAVLDARRELERQAAGVRAHQPAMELLQGIRLEPALVVLRGAPAEVLAKTAGHGHFDVVVVGTRGAGWAKTLLGSVSQALATDSPVPVLIAGPRTRGGDWTLRAGNGSAIVASTARDREHPPPVPADTRAST